MSDSIQIIGQSGSPAAIVDTAWYQYRGKAYVFPAPDGDGYLSYSADDGAQLAWSPDLKSAALDASLAEMDRMQ